MFVKRAFYVSQGALSVWTEVAGHPARTAVFAYDDDGLSQFDAYLSGSAEVPSAMLIDVIEEEFAFETVPRLNQRDRRDLLERRCHNKFRRTPYRLSTLYGKSARKHGELDVLYSAISNHELIDSWLQIVLRHRTPLSGIFSVPLLSPRVFRRLGAGGGNVLCVAPHQGDKLRQAFVVGGKVYSARLTQASAPDQPGYAEFVINEAVRSRRYLERLRLLNGSQVLEVCVVANAAVAARIRELTADADSMEFSVVDPGEAGRKLQGQPLDNAAHFEEVYVSAIMRRRPGHNYARAGENRYWTMRRLRQVLVGGSAAAAAVCSVLAAVLLSDTWFLHGRIAAAEAQFAQLSETFRRENERFDPIQAGSHEMKLAVDTGDFILTNRLPVPWVMNQLGVVLSTYPDIRLQELRWEVEAPDSNMPPPRRGEQTPPVPVHPVSTINATLTADIVPFDGDMRRAFARIDALARDLETRTDFSHAAIVEYPFNNNPDAAVSGEISEGTATRFARFRLSINYQVPGVNAGSAEGIDDAA